MWRWNWIHSEGCTLIAHLKLLSRQHKAPPARDPDFKSSSCFGSSTDNVGIIADFSCICINLHPVSSTCHLGGRSSRDIPEFILKWTGKAISSFDILLSRVSKQDNLLWSRYCVWHDLLVRCGWRSCQEHIFAAINGCYLMSKG